MAHERITLTVRANCKDIIVALRRVQSGLIDLLPVAPSIPDAPNRLERLDGNGFYELGRDAAQSSLDAHGSKVPVQDAWDFAKENLIDEENEAAYMQCHAMHDAPISFIAGYLNIESGDKQPMKYRIDQDVNPGRIMTYRSIEDAREACRLLAEDGYTAERWTTEEGYEAYHLGPQEGCDEAVIVPVQEDLS